MLLKKSKTFLPHKALQALSYLQSLNPTGLKFGAANLNLIQKASE